MCRKHDLRLLAEIPLHPRICEDADLGKPTVVSEPGGQRAKIFQDLAREVGRLVGIDK